MKRKQRFLKKMEEAMRFIYSHFLEEDESLADFMTSRVTPRPNIRHLVRNRMYHVYACTYEDIGKVEARLNGGTVRHHSTIGDSINKEARDYQHYNIANKTTKKLLNEFEEYWQTFHEVPAQERLKHYYEMPHHVLAAMVMLIEQLGWVEPIRMDVFYKQFRSISEEFVEQEISQ